MDTFVLLVSFELMTTLSSVCLRVGSEVVNKTIPSLKMSATLMALMHILLVQLREANAVFGD
jgi:hypothetical protein